MAALGVASAFFSGSEAALFYLSWPERRRMAKGNAPQRVAVRLLANPERLLTAVLFWNLVVNFVYFTLVSLAGLRLEQAGSTSAAWLFSIAALVGIIVLGEVVPKSLAVTRPALVASVVGFPLSLLVRALDPIAPVLRWAGLLSQRLFWPRFTGEPYLAVSDLERAVQFSTADASLVEQEQTVLQHIVQLSEMRVDELMRPRTRFRAFCPPVRLSDLQGTLPPSGYLLVTEPESDEVAGAIALRTLATVPGEHLEVLAEAVVYVPWCITVAQALEQMRSTNRQVAAVVNEFGETIGILTQEDILETIFTLAPSRTERLLQRAPIRALGPGVWLVNGMTSIRRLTRRFHVPRPKGFSTTVGGAIHEALERFPEPGDTCRFGPFEFRVLETTGHGQMLVELRLAPSEGEEP